MAFASYGKLNLPPASKSLRSVYHTEYEEVENTQKNRQS